MTALPVHGGHLLHASKVSGLAMEDLLDFSASINPLGFPDWLRPLISAQISHLIHYPDPDAEALVTALARHTRSAPEQIAVGNGASQLLRLLPQALGRRKILLPIPAYAEYQAAAKAWGLAVDYLLLEAGNNFKLDTGQLADTLDDEHLVILGQPHNPTGKLCDAAALRQLIRARPRNLFVIDESFIDFAGDEHSLRWQRPDNVIIVQSMTKSWGIPGLRLGYVLANRQVIAALRQLTPDWSVNSLALAVGERALRDDDFLPRTRVAVDGWRQELAAGLSQFSGLQPMTSAANFLLVRIDHPSENAVSLADKLLRQGILVRVCSNFAGLDQHYFRVAVRPPAEQQRLFNALSDLRRQRPGGIRPRKTPALMFQGTGSNAGKSILTAALCRIFHQDGLRVAPFKAQNMSLNSCVTFQGGEMGRAQVLQAQACHLDPDVRMNPVLLKPSSATGSQVIVRGKVLETLDFRDYAARRQQLFTQVRQCYDSLAAEHQVMVLEGAGSPAEINLKDGDIVNMKMARHAGAQVLLVGDIDRGGVFAALAGTMELLSEWERALISGFVINRFRGDATLLGDALERISRRTGKPFYGIIPYLPNLGLPEEDSVDFKDGLLETRKPDADVLDIALIDLPHISNFTDVDALRIEPDVRVRRITALEQLGDPDAILLPGSKNVIRDRDYLFRSGLAQAIRRLAEQRTIEIVGICGGYQLLGQRIADPHGRESSGGDCQGLGLLPLTTTLEPLKTTTRCRARHLDADEELYGYEIHHGSSTGTGLHALLRRSDGTVIGSCVRQRDWIWGTYLHGLFDADGFRRWFLDRLRVRKGWPPLGTIQARYNLEPALDHLADQVRASLDMAAIYRMLQL